MHVLAPRPGRERKVRVALQVHAEVEAEGIEGEGAQRINVVLEQVDAKRHAVDVQVHGAVLATVRGKEGRVLSLLLVAPHRPRE